MSAIWLAGALGLVMFSFGLLSALLVLFQPYSSLAWIWGNLAIGLLLIVFSVAWRFDEIRERMRSGGGRRAGLYGSGTIAQVVIGLAILGMLAFLSTRYSHAWDWSEQAVNTLSEQSQKVLDGLGRDVTITAFFREDQSPAVRDLLRRYQRESPHVKLRFVDPNTRPDLVDSMGVTRDELSGGVAVLSTDTGQGTGSVKVTKFSESDLTNAFVKLTRKGEHVVYLLQGHNERPFEKPAKGEPSGGESADGPEGFSRAAAALENETWKVEPLLLATQGEVPADADAVVIAGPTRPFFETELAALEAYLARGGGLFVMIDPRAQTNLYPELERWGVVVGDDVIVDRAQSLFGQATTPLSGPIDHDHPIGATLSRTLFHMARSVTVAPAEKGAEPPDFDVVVSSGPASWAERDLDAWMQGQPPSPGPDDLIGPVPMVVAGTPRVATEGDVKPRLLVIGDSNFASNEFIDSFSNRDLWINGVGWTIGDVDTIAVHPNESRDSSVTLTADQFQRIQYLSLFVLPEGIAFLGVIAWWSRRRGAGAA